MKQFERSVPVIVAPRNDNAPRQPDLDFRSRVTKVEGRGDASGAGRGEHPVVGSEGPRSGEFGPREGAFLQPNAESPLEAGGDRRAGVGSAHV